MPCVVVAETNVVPIGIGLDTVTLGARFGPRLVTSRLKEAFPPGFTVAGPVTPIAISVGPSGTLGVTAFDGADSALFPTALVACTVKV